ncbi:hypothetical protein O3M35_005761 [Rhynocoris fuscipes]|uniref:Uncharacterized protein n=1 Tax=Rhynocoris fuscipes TaxID=488301 RepID=A0AAW1DK46_9HEMI
MVSRTCWLLLLKLMLHLKKLKLSKNILKILQNLLLLQHQLQLKLLKRLKHQRKRRRKKNLKNQMMISVLAYSNKLHLLIVARLFYIIKLDEFLVPCIH